jgi:uncharacterized membrane protein
MVPLLLPDLAHLAIAGNSSNAAEIVHALTAHGMQGTWGLWHVPGSARFHVYWTGLAEVAGALGVIVGGMAPSAAPRWLLPASSSGLFLLTLAVTPSNVYSLTHNAFTWRFHVFRGAVQIIWLATWLGLARAAWCW